MLGIGQIEQRIGELVKGAMPFAIVNNGTNSDGTLRPMSRFAKLISYTTVQQAIDAGAKRIEVAKGLYPGFTIESDQGGITIRGEGKYSGTIIDGSRTKIAVEILGSNTIIQDLEAKTTSGGVGGYDAFAVGDASNAPGDIRIENCYVSQSDANGVTIYHASAVNLINLRIAVCDGYGIYGSATSGTSNQHLIENCYITGPFGAYPLDLTVGTGHRILGNDISGGTGYQINTYITNIICVGNRVYGDGSAYSTLRIQGVNGVYIGNTFTNWATAYYYDTGSGNNIDHNISSG